MEQNHPGWRRLNGNIVQPKNPASEGTGSSSDGCAFRNFLISANKALLPDSI